MVDSGDVEWLVFDINIIIEVGNFYRELENCRIIHVNDWMWEDLSFHR